ncbi:MAG: restriction endonuclease subunit S [Methanoregula sp.]
MTSNSDILNECTPTELDELPEGWDIKPLSKIISFRKGRKPNNLSEIPANDTVPYLTADYFRTGIPSQYVNHTKDPSAILVSNDDVVFIWDGSNAGDVFLGLNGVLASTMTVIRADQNIVLNDWIYYVLKTNFPTFNTQTTGSTIPHVNKNIFLNLPIPLPPLPEQHAIATTLRTVQEAKEKTDAVIAAIKALKAAMMKHLFTYGPVPPEDAERVALKETEIGPVPEEWDVAKFSDVVEIAKGQIDPTTEPYNKLLHIGPENIVSGTGQVIRMRTAEEINLISGQFYFTSEHVIYSKIRPYLKKVAFPKIEGTCSADMYPLKPQDARLFSEFLFQYLLSDQFSNSAISFQDRTGIPKINRQQIGMIHLPIPPLTIQKQIATILSSIDQKLVAEQSRREALDTLFASLLHDLMTAKIRVSTA